MEILKSQNVTVELNWTPSHAEITGNKKADKLTKEAPGNMPEQGTKIFQYCTCAGGQVTYIFHLSCKHMHLSFEGVCNKEHKGVL